MADQSDLLERTEQKVPFNINCSMIFQIKYNIEMDSNALSIMKFFKCKIV